MNNTSIKPVRKIQGKYLSQSKKCEFETYYFWLGLVQKNQPTRLVRVWEKGWGRGHSPEDLRGSPPLQQGQAGACRQEGVSRLSWESQGGGHSIDFEPPVRHFPITLTGLGSPSSQ